MKTYLVTGAAGFIGSNFVKYILDKYGDNIEVIILDALTYAGNLASIKEEIERPNVTFIRGDVRDRELVQDILNNSDVDYIVNFAAESHVDRSITNPRLFLEVNILGTQNMLDCAREAWFTGKDAQGRNTYAPGKKYLQISTDEVYGSLSKDFDEPQPLEVSDDVREVIEGRTDLKTFGRHFFTEETPLAPRSPYSASKTSADLITMAYHETYGLPVNITRCSNNYGPYHFPEKLIPLIIKNILEGKKLPVYGKGENVRDWLYVEDHARAIDLIFHKGTIAETYNIGGFNEWKNIDIIKTVIKTVDRLLGRPEGADLDLITYVTDRAGHDMRYAIDSTKLQKELGWEPSLQFEEGIEKTVRWYLDNQPWLDNITSGEYEKYYEEMYKGR
jgi:dTDP-glucose 4,6-dehydratase